MQISSHKLFPKLALAVNQKTITNLIWNSSELLRFWVLLLKTLTFNKVLSLPEILKAQSPELPTLRLQFTLALLTLNKLKQREPF